ncbi:MAG: RHS repeat-associated core domain-containing protein, partial [Gammaproteobacteria bacterium]
MGRADCTAERMNPATFGSPPLDACALGTAGAFGPDRITRNSYDSAGRLSRVQAGYGTADRIDMALYTYTVNGQMASLTDANGNRAEMGYDGHDRQKRWVFPSKTSTGAVDPNDYEEYSYDPNDNRTSLRKRDGSTLNYSYDALSRMTQKTVTASPTGAAGYSVHYGYDLRGLQGFARFGSLGGPGIANAWDALGRLASSTTNMDGTNRTFASQYDRNSNRIGLTGDGGYHAVFEHDGLDRLTAYREGDSGTLIAQLAYDNQGRRISLARGSGPLASTVSYGYDSISRLSSLGHD